MRQAAAEGYEVSYGLLNVAILITFVLAYLLLHGVLKRPPQNRGKTVTGMKQPG